MLKRIVKVKPSDVNILWSNFKSFRSIFSSKQDFLNADISNIIVQESSGFFTLNLVQYGNRTFSKSRFIIIVCEECKSCSNIDVCNDDSK